MRIYTSQALNDALAFFPWPDFENIFNDDFDGFGEIDEWCEQNLKGQFAIMDEGVYVFEDFDAILYKMTWGGKGVKWQD